MTIIYILLGIVALIAILAFIRGRSQNGDEKVFRFLADEMKETFVELDERLRDSGKEMMESLKYQNKRIKNLSVKSHVK